MQPRPQGLSLKNWVGRTRVAVEGKGGWSLRWINLFMAYFKRKVISYSETSISLIQVPSKVK